MGPSRRASDRQACRRGDWGSGGMG
jgi:hypothetical protein